MLVLAVSRAGRLFTLLACIRRYSSKQLAV